MMLEIINFNIDNNIYLYVYEIINIEILCNKDSHGRIYILNQADLFAKHLTDYINYSHGITKSNIDYEILNKKVCSFSKEIIGENNVDFLIRYVD